MESFVKADIFFFVTTVAVIAAATGLIVALVYLIKILNDVRQISGKVRAEGEEFVKDARDLRTHFKEKGIRLIDFLSLISKFARPKPKRKAKDVETSPKTKE